jgi:cell division GTPase FtsZ
VNKIISAGRIEAEYLAINTDRRVLEACLAGRKILIGEQRFQGRGGAQPHVIMEESAAAVEAIRQTCAGRVRVSLCARASDVAGGYPLPPADPVLSA